MKTVVPFERGYCKSVDESATTSWNEREIRRLLLLNDDVERRRRRRI